MTDFSRLTEKQREVLGAIAINEDGGHAESTLLSLEKRGLIVWEMVPMGGHPPMNIRRWYMPLPVHIEWCEWCSQQVDTKTSPDVSG